MPSSVKSVSSSTDRRRLSQSLNRVAALGHLAGIDPANLPPFRTDSPMTVMQDELRILYGAPSLESMTSVDAVVTQIEDPRTPFAPPQPEPGSGRHSRRDSLALSDSGRSTRSTGSRGSRSRARNQALEQQHSQVVREAKDPYLRQQIERRKAERALNGDVSRPPLSHPEILVPAHMRASSEAAIDTRSTARKRHSMALRGAQSRKGLAVPEPEWVKETYKGSRFANASQEVIPRLPPMPLPTEGGMSYSSRRSSTATVTQDSYMNEPKMPSARDGRKSGTVKSVSYVEDDDLRSVSSARSAATTSYIPRGFGIAPEKKQLVKARGVSFEMFSPPAVRTEPNRQIFRPLSVVIPPSQEPARSFNVRAVGRSPTPASVSSPSTASASPTDSFTSSAHSYNTRPSTRGSGTTVSRSRSPSPARGSFNPGQREKSFLNRVEKLSDDFHRKAYQVKQYAGVEPRNFELRGRGRRSPQEDIAAWQCPSQKEPLRAPVTASPVTTASEAASPASISRGSTSFAARAAAVGGPEKALRRITAYIPSAPVQAIPAQVTSSTTLREQESAEMFVRNTTQKRTSFLPSGREPQSSKPQSSKPQSNVAQSNVPRSSAPSLSKRDRNSESLRRLDFGFSDKQPAPPVRAETPPCFEVGVQRNDSLCLGASSSRTQPPATSFFPSWTEQQQAKSNVVSSTGAKVQPYRRLNVLSKPSPLPVDAGHSTATDDRRMLPSQRAQSSASTLQRKAVANAAAPAGPSMMQPTASSSSAGAASPGRALRKTTNIDFAKMRENS
ncbi:hypothetical protein SUNI508_01548 [Seiridium unicorne]|uniref:Proteophosphoglycan ppg4 n=1 Tax=Seiridium unicorne TaxID=138068 RepID=A0ABR2UU29_9PEZI